MDQRGAEHTHDGLRLCDFLEQRPHHILAEWERRVRALPAASRLSSSALRDEIPLLLERLSHIIRGVHTGQPPTLQDLPSLHALARLDAGYDLGTASRELGLLRDTILELWEREASDTLPLQEVRRLNRAMDDIISVSVEHFARARERTLRAMDQVSSAALGTGDLDTFLPQIMKLLRETVATVDAVAVFLEDDTRRTLRPRASLGLEEAGVHGAALERLEAFAASVARQQTPRSLHGTTAPPGQGLLALYAIPLVHEGRTLGVTLIGSSTAHDFSADDKQLTRATAQRLTSLIIQSQLVERLRRSEARLRAIVAHAPAAIYVKDSEGHFLVANHHMEAIFHRPISQLLGRTDHDLLPKETADAFRANDLEVLRGGVPLEREEVILREDGPHTYLSVKFLLPAEHGGADELCGISTDFTERKRAEAALRETSERLKAVLDTAVDSIILINEHGIIQSLNPATTRLFGYAPEELQGFNVSKLMPEPDRGRHDAYLQNYLRTGVRKIIGIGREVMGQRKDGTLFPLELSVSELRLPQGRFFTGMLREISERKAAQQAQTLLVEASTLLAQSLDVPTTLRNLATLAVMHLADYCVVDLVGEDGLFHRLEARAREPSRQELTRRLLPYPTAPGSPLGRVLEEGRPQGMDLTPELLSTMARGPEHQSILEALDISSLTALPLLARGRKLGLIGLASTRPGLLSSPSHLRVAQALADRAAIAIDNARLHAELHEAVRMREDVVAIVSHDLRNPLNAITLSAATLTRHAKLDERTGQVVARIDTAARRAHRLIRDLLDFTQARVGGIPLSPRPADVHVIARQVAEEFRSAHPERRIELRTEGEGQGQWDADRLAQVLANLVGNAVQHSPADSPVRLEAAGSEGEVILSVHNRGAPIPPELLPILFEPFRRGREARGKGEGSLGLGLFISRSIVEAHRGRLEVRSTAEAGTTFTVRLPRLPADSTGAVRW